MGFAVPDLPILSQANLAGIVLEVDTDACTINCIANCSGVVSYYPSSKETLT